jgi:hypothetical protein
VVFFDPFDPVALRLPGFAPVRREEVALFRVPDFAGAVFLADGVWLLERWDDVTVDFFAGAVLPATRAPDVAPIGVPPALGVAVAGPAS